MLTDIDRLSRCLDALDDAQRSCLLLSFYEGYSNQELADHLGLPLGTVKARIRRGLVRLRQCLEAGR
ncbi:MAG: sigma-70 family RNA polymerase sigma factor [Gammaproteobacteria bacterium]|nr:sigma-70 family RNA polymerase sigma factor [Gammaproteobacteria bacterium]